MMTTQDHDTIARQLLDSDAEFRQLHEEHQDYERRLGEINQKSFPSQEDEIAEKKIKLHKLALKDRMEQMISTAEATHREPVSA